MATLNVIGLPLTIKLSKIVYLFRSFLKRVNIQNFWIREIADLPDADFQEVTVEFETNTEAYDAQSVLDNLPFKYQGQSYPLRAKVNKPYDYGMNHSRSKRESSRDRRERHDRNYYRDQRRMERSRSPYYHESSKHERRKERSRSPLYRHDTSKLDMEIELLRKQRLVIEEERRLLLEKKKLELMKEFGPSISRDYRYLERSRSRERRHSPKRINHRQKPTSTSVPYENSNPTLPAFIMPCKLLLNEMRDTINREAQRSDIPVLVKLIRLKLRQNIAIILENKQRMNAKQIVELYRQIHPKDKDPSFIKKILTHIRYGQLSEKNRNNEVTERPAKIKAENITLEPIEANEKTAGDIDEEEADTDGNSDVTHITNDSGNVIEDFDKDMEERDEKEPSLYGTDTQLSINYDGNTENWFDPEQDFNEDKESTADDTE